LLPIIVGLCGTSALWLSPVVSQSAPSGPNRRAAERVIRRRHLVGHVLHDVGAVGHAGEVRIHHQSHQPVGVRVRHVRSRIDIDAAVLGKSRVDGDAHHARLSFAEQVVRKAGVAIHAGHAQQRIDLAGRQHHGQAPALFGEEHRAVIHERHVPWIVETVEHDTVLKAAGVHAGLRKRWHGTCRGQYRGE